MVDVPRSLQDKAIEERVRRDMEENLPPPSVPVGLARSFFGEGLGMGWGDEAESWIRSKLGQGTYEDIRKGITRENARFAERYPISSGVSEFAGGAAPALAAYYMTPATGGAAAPVAAAQTARSMGALGRIAANPYTRAGAIGAGQGAITGAGQAETGADIPLGAAGGTILGAGIGAAAPVAIRTGKAGLDWLRERALPSDAFVRDRALRQISGALESDGIKPGDVLATVQQDQAMGVPSMFANASPSLARLADVITNRAGKAAAGTRLAFEELKEGSRERVMQQVRSGVSGRNYFKDESDAVNKLRTEAKTAYDDAYAFGSVQDPRIDRVLQNPKFAAFFEKAKQIADNEATAAELRGENPAKYKLQELYRTKTDKDGNLVGFELVSVPDVRTLDYIKRGIDSVIESGFEGKGITKPEANSLKELRKAYISAIDDATIDPKTGKSAYAEARKDYAGDMEVIDAMRLGFSDFRSLPSEQVSELMKTMSTAEKEAFRTGAARSIYSIIMDPSNEIDAAKRLVGSPEMRAKLGEIFETPAKRDLFMAAVKREQELFRQAQRVLGGSQTAERLAMRESFEEGSNFGEMVAQALNQGGFKNALTAIAARAISKTRMNDDVAEEISKRLTSKDPKDVAAAVQELEDYAKSVAPKEKRLTYGEQGVGSGTNVSIYPSPVDEEAAAEEASKSMKGERPAPDVQLDIEEELKKWREKNLPK